MSVPPERLARWIAGFTERHGQPTVEVSATQVNLSAPDGAQATCLVPFPPLAFGPGEPIAALLAHAGVDRRIGVLLVRKGGYAAGVFAGTRLMTSKTGSRHVQGRSAAGGWSQQRFARRREAQARVALAAAADAAALTLLPEAGTLDAVVLGGDRRALAEVLDDTRLAPLRRLVVDRILDVPEPRRQVLEATPADFRAVRIKVVDPAATPTP